MKPLIDGDILRYEVGFAAETGWQSEEIPPWEYVEDMLLSRIDAICREVEASEPYTLYLSGTGNFRDEVAITKPYKGTRKSTKPWHWSNLTAYMVGVLNATVVNGIEADDQIAIDHVKSNGNTIICSRDKDLRQIPGWFFSWELGKQPSFGPLAIDKDGWLSKRADGKVVGVGNRFFYYQCLTGDTVDNIPGLPGWGPVKAYEWLEEVEPEEVGSYICTAYMNDRPDDWEEYLTEQGQLLWMVRRLDEDGNPVLWQIGMEE